MKSISNDFSKLTCSEMLSRVSRAVLWTLFCLQHPANNKNLLAASWDDIHIEFKGSNEKLYRITATYNK